MKKTESMNELKEELSQMKERAAAESEACISRSHMYMRLGDRKSALEEYEMGNVWIGEVMAFDEVLRKMPQENG